MPGTIAEIELDAGNMTLGLHNELYESNVVFGDRDLIEFEKIDPADIPVVKHCKISKID